ncbi:hypothetical protein PRIPAC_96296 [Pristionchus pacificus]|uniref:Uncharacterized protein n=1 Tax=Pristionchus pacificus TaxID=54126 RepID=A0A2A6BBU7_PRIPA|nr:hypothetical protein PRIPAC_96296 [Pristionchus pacificus]|eukprot:PDM63350.1 hypothetical protein PRIPAC_53707 [Pristionchus pacificus]
MKVVQALAFFSFASLITFSEAREQTMEEFYCTPIREQYPVKKENIECLSSKPPFRVCPVKCSLVKTEEVWMTFEVIQGGVKKTMDKWAYPAAKCDTAEHDDWKILGRSF